jgi:hypothetical protein
VLVGDGGDDPLLACSPNTLNGPLTLSANSGGLEVGANHVTGPVSVTNNTAPGPDTENQAPELEHNTITGPLACSGNTPAPVDDGQANTVTGPRGGQCSLSGF